MNIYLNSISNYAASFMEDRVLPVLSAQHKKILIIVSLALGFLAACYALRHCLPTKKNIAEPVLKPLEEPKKLAEEQIEKPVLKLLEEPEKLVEEQIEKPAEEYEDEVLKRHEKKVYSDPHLVEYAQLNQSLILKLENEVDIAQQITNTGLTELLVHYTFTSVSLKFDDLHDLLKALVEEALTHHNLHAKLALTRPNNPQTKVKDLKGVGFPQNTPLALLVKAGDLEGSQLILPVYEKEDLLFTTPRGNTVLHLAIITGQMKLAAALINRAKELNMLQEILEMKNSAGKTADDMLTLFLLLPKDHLFKHFLDVVNPYLGGDEINKAWIRHETQEAFKSRSRLISDLSEIIQQDYTLAELKGFNLTAISQMI